MKTQLDFDLAWGGYYASTSSDDRKISIFRLLDFSRDAYHAALFGEEFADIPTLAEVQTLSPFIGHAPIYARSMLMSENLQLIGRRELFRDDLEGYIYYLEAHGVVQDEINDWIEQILGFSRDDSPIRLRLEIVEDELTIVERE